MDSQAPVPDDVGKSLRCCTGCKLVKSVAQVWWWVGCSMHASTTICTIFFTQFYETGCDNGCFSEDQDVEEFITTKFSG